MWPEIVTGRDGTTGEGPLGDELAEDEPPQPVHTTATVTVAIDIKTAKNFRSIARDDRATLSSCQRPTSAGDWTQAITSGLLTNEHRVADLDVVLRPACPSAARHR